MSTEAKAQGVPEILSQILSPYSSKNHVENMLNTLLKDEALLDLTIELANRYFLIPTFYCQLCKYQLENQLNEELHAFLLEMTSFMKERSLSLASLVEEIVEVSNKAGMTPLLIKGSTTLFLDLYPDKGIRFMSDLDILFKEEHALQIFHMLKASGFSVPEKYLAEVKPAYLEDSRCIESLLPSSQDLLPLYREGAPCGVEVHHRPLSHFFDCYLNSDQAFSSALRIEFPQDKNLSALRMSPENEVIYCFVHSERTHRFHEYHIFDLRQMDFFVRLVYIYKENLDWDEIYKRIESTGEAKLFQYYLYTINQLFALDFPINKSLVTAKELEKHYKKGLSSCFPKYNRRWRTELVIAEIKHIFSKRGLSNRHCVDTNLDLFKARLYCVGELIIKFLNPVKLYRRLQCF